MSYLSLIMNSLPFHYLEQTIIFFIIYAANIWNNKILILALKLRKKNNTRLHVLIPHIVGLPSFFEWEIN